MTSPVRESLAMLMREAIWGSGVRFARRGRLLQDSEVEIDSLVPRKYYVASDAEEHGALA